MNIIIKACVFLCCMSVSSGIIYCANYSLTLTCATTDSLSLVDFYNNSQGQNWTVNWDFNQPIHTWHGVTVDANGCVIVVDLINVLDGPISGDIGDLSNLQELYLGGENTIGALPAQINQLQSLKVLHAHNIGSPFQSAITDLVNLERFKLAFGDNSNLSPIPASIGNMAALTDLAISNGINGNIPVEIGQLEQLESLNFQNCFFSGAMPAQIGQLQKLKSLIISGTSLTGSIPTEIGDLVAVEKIVLTGNELNGSIPSSIGDLPNLMILNLNANSLTGSIPPQLGQVTTLVDLSLKQNLLGNSIPVDFQNLVNLSYLNLSNNQLSGDILSELALLTNLNILDLSWNSLTGVLPDELGSMTSLNKLRIQGNSLSGSIPHTFANLYGIEKMYLGSNNLTGCFDVALAAFCDRNTLLVVDKGNNFGNSFKEFCATGIGECECSFNRFLSDNISPDNYKAENNIISDGVVNASNTLFQAGNTISLEPDFMTMPNVLFEAIIDNCN